MQRSCHSKAVHLYSKPPTATVKNRLPLSAIDLMFNFTLQLISDETAALKLIDSSGSEPLAMPFCEDPHRAKTNAHDVWQTYMQYLETPAHLNRLVICKWQ